MEPTWTDVYITTRLAAIDAALSRLRCFPPSESAGALRDVAAVESEAADLYACFYSLSGRFVSAEGHLVNEYALRYRMRELEERVVILAAIKLRLVTGSLRRKRRRS